MIPKDELIQIVEHIANNSDGNIRPNEQIKAVEFLLANGDQGDGSIEQVWDELFLVGVSQDDE